MKPGDLIKYAVPRNNGKISHWEIGVVLDEPFMTSMNPPNGDSYVRIMRNNGVECVCPMIWVVEV